MKSAFQFKFERYQLLKQKYDKILKIEEQERILKYYTNHEIKVTNARVYYAASRINALVRGFLDRAICKKLRLQQRAIQLIQKVFKGKLGRLRWRKEYWRSLSIVKSDSALKEILERSTMIREKIVRNKKYRDHWKEMYDPLTEAFWYYNQITKQNTWQIPVCFQNKLICYWSGFESAGGISGSEIVSSQLFISHLQQSNYKSLPHIPCRCVFATVPEYYNHLRTMHSWYCIACFNKNPGLSFPVCTLCQNRYSEKGEDALTVLKETVEDVQSQLQEFIDRDFSSESGNNSTTNYFNQTVPYHIRDRIIEIATERKETLEAIKRVMTSTNAPSSASVDDLNPIDSKNSKRNKLEQIKQGYIKKMSVTFSQRQQRTSVVASALADRMFNKGNGEPQTSKLPPIPGARPAQSPKKSSQGKTPRVKSITKTGSVHNIQTPSPGFRSSSIKSVDDESSASKDYYSNVNNEFPSEIMDTSVTRKMKQKIWLDEGGEAGEEEKFSDPITKGIFSESDFRVITSVHDDAYADFQLELLSEGEEDDDESSADGAIYSNKIRKAGTNSTIASRISITSTEKKEEMEKQFVCMDYLKGKCTKTTCASAHPGIRDRAKIHHKSFRNPDGKGRTRIPYVFVCPDINQSLDDCFRGMNCHHYHRYIRPKTEEIILALYPINTGHRIKYFPSGAKYIGNVKDNVFHGYGKIIYPDGSFYQGDWQRNVKHGFGIYCNDDLTVQYIGQFKHGKRHGIGILKNQLGDEYIGQWEDGKMSGIGILSSQNGDFYRGQFSNNHYHGIGMFIKKNGDVYLGYCMNGRAHGLGILSLRNGEKYKGYFERNARHGKGACIYSNGCKYFGHWYRGVHHGYGVFISHEKEKYVGEWSGGKKHGTGRYYFTCGDFYDGQFFKNKAKGLGVYYYVNGNLFTGEWDNDMKNGRGTYLFDNGSKYTGNFVDNDIHGKGKFDFATGAFYRGNFDFNTKHGKGIYTWPNGNVYKGDFFHEKLCGKGELTYVIGHRYVGEWKDNKKNGFGIMYYNNGSVYEGQFVDDIRQGKGKLTLSLGTPVEEVYEGDWEDDQWHGKGKYWYRRSEGTVYEGDWVYGIREGKGTLSFQDGGFYRGDFKRDQMWGNGIFVDGVTNTQYDGEWRANMRQGFGTCFTVDGGIYHGEWFGNMKQGKGKLYNKDGTIYEGTWDANVIIGSGKVTIKVGDEKKRDGLPKQVTVKVFGY